MSGKKKWPYPTSHTFRPQAQCIVNLRENVVRKRVKVRGLLSAFIANGVLSSCCPAGESLPVDAGVRSPLPSRGPQISLSFCACSLPTYPFGCQFTLSVERRREGREHQGRGQGKRLRRRSMKRRNLGKKGRNVKFKANLLWGRYSSR